MSRSTLLPVVAVLLPCTVALAEPVVEPVPPAVPAPLTVDDRGLPLFAFDEVPADPVLRGAYLYRVAGCVGCHSPPGSDRPHLSGGRDNPTVFGTFYAPNISPDPEDGIGAWTEEDFHRALRDGRAPDGRAYWPTFPYMAYTGMTDEDIHALWSYLRTQPAVKGTVPPQEPGAKVKTFLFAWRWMALSKGPWEPEPDRSPEWNRGEYLVQAVSYCDQCHTPRTGTGVLVRKHYLAGGANPGKDELHPNITPDVETGIGDWTADDIVRYLSTGTDPDGVPTRPHWVMREKIDDSFGWYTDADKRAIAAYLQSVRPVRFDPEAQGWIPPEALERTDR
jgi:mono/diheme cytochrome c family protein